MTTFHTCLRRFARLMLGAMILALGPAQAGEAESETRMAAPGAQAPAARVADLAWLIGHWTGPGIDGAAAGETWSQADDSRLVGHFFQLAPDGSLRFLELMMLHPQGNSVELRLKHFNADLTAWEKQEDFLRFPLIAVEPDVWYFNGLTIRRIDPQHMTITLRMRDSGSGKSREIPFAFTRQAGRH